MILICFSGVLNMLKTMALKFFENSEKKFDGRHAIWKLLITFEVKIVKLFTIFNFSIVVSDLKFYSEIVYDAKII